MARYSCLPGFGRCGRTCGSGFGRRDAGRLARPSGLPAAAILAAGTAADNCVGLTYVVTSEVPFHLMVELVTKLVPVAVKVNAPEPAIAVLGSMLVKVGTGLVLVIVNVSALLVPPPGNGVNTVTGAVPVEAILAAGTIAVS